jgi:hypothetical protein
VRALSALMLGACLCSVGLAHEVRPAYLDIKEEAPGTFDVLFKTPMVGDLRLSLGVSFSGQVQALTPVTSRTTGEALIQTWRIRASEGLAGHEVRIVGLENTVSDALLRVEFADGRSWDQRLTPAAPVARVPAAASGSGVAATYFSLGVEHILLGYDHLLFVLGLFLLTSTFRQMPAPSRRSPPPTASLWRPRRSDWCAFPQSRWRPSSRFQLRSWRWRSCGRARERLGSPRGHLGSWHSRSGSCTASGSPAP